MSIIPFDDRDGAIWLDGGLTPWRSANIHVLNHGLHYGSCVFEGLRAYGGRIFRLREHCERLMASAALLGFDLPYAVEQIEKACLDVLAANRMSNAYLRPVAWRGSEQMGVAARATRARVAVACWKWDVPFTPEASERGIALLTTKWRRPAPDTAPTRSKAAGLYMICTLSKHWAEELGAQDALMLDYRGLVAETTGANIFFVKNGVVHTPTPDCFLDGITRRTVIELARLRGIEVVERAIQPSEVQVADEVFITGTAAEVTPVSRIDDTVLRPGAVTLTLMKDYDDLVNGRAPAVG
jgi:branched-chain amino acid aminotransferase